MSDARKIPTADLERATARLGRRLIQLEASMQKLADDVARSSQEGSARP